MRRFLLAATSLALLSTCEVQPVAAQSGPNWPQHYSPPASEWQKWWTAKMDASNFVMTPTTLQVCPTGCAFSDPLAAFYTAMGLAHLGQVVVTIQIADGTYNETGQAYTTSNDGGLVQIIGNTANPAAVVLDFTNISGNNGAGFLANAGGRIGLIDGMTINGVGAIVGSTVANMTGSETATGTSWNAQSYGAGVAALGGGSYIRLGPHVVINHFYYGVVADNNGMVDAPQGGVTATDSGDVNFMARGGGTIVCNSCHGIRAADNTPGQTTLGANYDAERGGTLYIDGSTGAKSLIGGVVGLTGGAIWAHQVTLSGGLTSMSNGVNAWENSKMELTGSHISGYAIGIDATSGGYVAADQSVISGNSSDGIMADGGRVDGSSVTSTGNGGYGVHAIHQGIVHLYATLATVTGNTAGVAAVEAAGTLNGFAYQGSSLVMN